jgi:hypothetical protein
LGGFIVGKEREREREGKELAIEKYGHSGSENTKNNVGFIQRSFHRNIIIYSTRYPLKYLLILRDMIFHALDGKHHVAALQIKQDITIRC